MKLEKQIYHLLQYRSYKVSFETINNVMFLIACSINMMVSSNKYQKTNNDFTLLLLYHYVFIIGLPICCPTVGALS